MHKFRNLGKAFKETPVITGHAQVLLYVLHLFWHRRIPDDLDPFRINADAVFADHMTQEMDLRPEEHTLVETQLDVICRHPIKQDREFLQMPFNSMACDDDVVAGKSRVR